MGPMGGIGGNENKVHPHHHAYRSKAKIICALSLIGAACVFFMSSSDLFTYRFIEKAEVADMHHDLVKAQSELAALRKKYDALTVEKKTASGQLTNAKKRLSEAEDELTEIKGEQAQVAEELATAKDELSTTKELMNDARSAKDDLEAQLEEKATTLAQKESEAETLKANLEEMESKVAAAEVVVKDTKTDKTTGIEKRVKTAADEADEDTDEAPATTTKAKTSLRGAKKKKKKVVDIAASTLLAEDGEETMQQTIDVDTKDAHPVDKDQIPLDKDKGAPADDSSDENVKDTIGPKGGVVESPSEDADEDEDKDEDEEGVKKVDAVEESDEDESQSPAEKDKGNSSDEDENVVQDTAKMDAAAESDGEGVSPDGNGAKKVVGTTSDDEDGAKKEKDDLSDEDPFGVAAKKQAIAKDRRVSTAVDDESNEGEDEGEGPTANDADS